MTDAIDAPLDLPFLQRLGFRHWVASKGERWLWFDRPDEPWEIAVIVVAVPTGHSTWRLSVVAVRAPTTSAWSEVGTRGELARLFERHGLLVPENSPRRTRRTAARWKKTLRPAGRGVRH